MSDWYVSSAAWTAIAQFAASTSYSVGQIVRPLTAPAQTAQYAFRCTTAGTSSTEPVWPGSNNATVTTGGATFTNVSGQAAYGWSAAAGNLYSFTNSATSSRPVAGDRVFLSSDHSETITVSAAFAFGLAAFGVIQFISVNRAGSVPPIATDQLSGAVLGTSAAVNITIDAICDTYWQGVTFNAGAALTFNAGGTKRSYLRNCTLVLTRTTTGDRIGAGNPAAVTLDNTVLQFNHTAQGITGASGYPLDLTWINTPAALGGTAVPTGLVQNVGSVPNVMTFRGLDLNALTTAIISPLAASFSKLLLDSCRIASGLNRGVAPVAANSANDEIELVNCFDGTNILSERHTPAGDLTTNRSTTLTGGAQDDVGLFSHQMVSSTRSDFLAMTLDSFWMDVENAFMGASKTATVEIISSSTLNNTDIALMLEYLGTSGSSLATFGNSLPSALTASAALPISTAVWNNPPAGYTTWNPSDQANITLSGANLTASPTAAGGVRDVASVSSGKYYWEVTVTTWAGSAQVGIANAAAILASCASTGTNTAFMHSSGAVYVNGSSSGVLFGSRSNGDTICVAVDVGAQLIWFRVGAGGNWNTNATYNPATGTGGVSFSAITSASFYALAAFSVTGAALTANFGATSYVGAVPGGFSSLLAPASVQHLQVTFTPQQTGRLRGIVRLGKPSTTVYINPQITVS